MRIVISDSSCLIDLHKVGLLEHIFGLPFTFAIPHPLFEEELLSITAAEKQMMVDAGMDVSVLPGEQVIKAQRYFNDNRRLKLNDCFALVLAEETENSILFTGDKPLRALAESMDIEAHGVLWLVDHLIDHGLVEGQLLLDTLEMYLADPLVRFPENEIRKRIRRVKALI